MGFDQLSWLFMYNGESLHARVCARASYLAFVRGACMAHVVPAGAHAMLTPVPGLGGWLLHVHCWTRLRVLPHVSVTHYASVSCIGYTIRGLHLR